MSASRRSFGIHGRRCWNWGSRAIVLGVLTGAIGVLCSLPKAIHSSDVLDLKISVRIACSSLLLRAWSAKVLPGHRSNRSDRPTPLVVVTLVAVDLVVRPLVGPPALDAVPVEVGGGVRLGHVEVATLSGRAGPDDTSQDGEGAVEGPGVDPDARVLGHVGEALLVVDDWHLAGPGVVGDAVAGHVLVGPGGAVTRDRT